MLEPQADHTRKKRVFIAGHQGMVGSALLRLLIQRPGYECVVAPRKELDLTHQDQVREFFGRQSIDEVYLAAGKVGGIYANQHYPAEFIYQNLIMACHVIHAAFDGGVKKLLYLGSSCIYPRLADQPIRESALMTGALEPTNDAYAIAKIAGIKLCEAYNRQYGRSHGLDYRSVMPCNLYGPGDHYHPENSHVIPGLLRRFHEAKIQGLNEVLVWGTGRALREFLFVDDLARACVKVMEASLPTYQSLTEAHQGHLNVGSGEEITIAELAQHIAQVVGYTGSIRFAGDKNDGMPRKLLDSSHLRSLGWEPEIQLAEGLPLAYADMKERYASFQS